MLGLSDIARLRGNVHSAVEQCLAITGKLEHGKAETPLSDPFTKILEALDQQPFYVVAVEISVGAGAPLLRRFGVKTDGMWEKLPSNVSAVEFRFDTSEEYRWQLNGGSRFSQSDTIERIYDHVAAIPDNTPDIKKVLILCVPAEAALHSTRILLVRTPELLARDPNLLLRLHAEAHLLVLCGAANYRLSLAERAVLGEIISSAQAVLPLVCANESDNAADFDWANAGALGSSCPLFAPVVATATDSQLDHPVLQAGSNARTALQYAAIARTLREAVEVLLAELERESRTITTRQAALAESERELDESAKGRDPRGELDRIKQLVEDCTAVLLEQIDEVNRRATQKKGPLTQLVRDLSTSISPESLISVSNARKIRKSLDPALVAKHTSEITRALRAQLMQDVAVISGQVGDLVRAVQTALASAGAANSQVSVPAFEHEKTWEYLQGELSLEGKGELEVEKATGFMFFMNGARSIIMPIFMTLSMVGINLRSQLTKQASTGQFGDTGRNWFGPALMIAGFVLAGLYYYLEKRKEREEQLYRDLNKIRDSVLGDASRMITDVQREKVSRIGSYIAEVRKAILRQSDQVLKKQQELLQRDLDRSKRELKAKARAFDATSREYIEFTRQLAKVQQACGELAGTCAKLLLESTASVTPVREASARKSIAEAVVAEAGIGKNREPLPERPPRLSLAERRAMRERG